jgi:hypothetical protein
MDFDEDVDLQRNSKAIQNQMQEINNHKYLSGTMTKNMFATGKYTYD